MAMTVQLGKGVVRRSGRPRESVVPGEQSYFATTFQGVESILAAELTALGARKVRIATRGVHFSGTLELMYKVNLWSRIAHRVLCPIGTFSCRDKDELYDAVRSIGWGAHMYGDQTLAVDAVGTNDKLVHTRYIAQVVKDGVVDWFRDTTGTRPSVDTRNPDFRINVRINRDRCVVSWDTSGERLHRRGYRGDGAGEAPLKENLAAAILMMSGYNGTGPLIDPMCGSGTLLVEAALMAENRAPGLMGRTFAFMTHMGFESRRWANLKADAQSAVREVEGCPIVGYDISDTAVRNARTAATGSGTDAIIRVKRQSIEDLPAVHEGHIITNPPYGERLDNVTNLVELYQTLGRVLKQRCRGTTAHVITSSRFLAGKIGLRASSSDPVWNGPLECRLLHYDVF